jgi:hypothetical protein
LESAARKIQNPEIEFTARSLDELIERHEREKAEFHTLTEPQQAKFQLKKLAEYSTHPWSFIRDCVYTLDQIDQRQPIKLFPSYLEYLELLCSLWQRHRMLAIPKSRRMTCSWNFISLYTWDTMFHPGRFNGFVSKKEDDASELVARAEFIYMHIPEWRIPRALLPKIRNGKMSKQPPLLEFEEINSKIQGFPQGADQLRQFTMSGILGDECAFWPDAQKFYSASAPTLEGGGRMTLISSRSPGFFKKIVFDKLDAQDLTFRETPPAPVKTPIEGVDIWRNPENKFVIVDLHYTANPAKRSRQWRESVRASLPLREFLMEYEKSWQTYEGKPVYADFNPKLHATPEPIEPEPGIPLLLAWDFGLTPACVICQLVGSQLRVLEEILESDGSINKLAPRVWGHISVNYPMWAHNASSKILNFIDPAGNQRAQTDANTCSNVLRTSGFRNIQPGPVDWETRRGAVENFLVGLSGGKPNLLISESGAPITYEGFNGGYRYPERALEIEPERIRPLKNKFSHPHDALQYAASGARAKLHEYGNITIKTPHYSFQDTRS